MIDNLTAATVATSEQRRLSDGNVTVAPAPTKAECVAALIDYLARVTAHR